MKYVVIRDDDTCFFTKPYMLEKIYQPLLNAGKSITLSVVPAIGGGQPCGAMNGEFWKRFQLDYSPCLPPHQRSKAQVFPLTPDCEIVRYLRERKGYEIVQHGYNHLVIDGVREGMLTNPRQVTEKIESSGTILENCFGLKSDFFVVPWDDVSAETIMILKRYYKGISLHRIGKRHISSWPRKIQVAGRRFLNDRIRTPYFRDGDFLLLEYPGPILSMFHNYRTMKEKVDDFLLNQDILVLVSHYWEYFWDWDEPNKKFISAWHDIASYLLN